MTTQKFEFRISVFVVVLFFGRLGLGELFEVMDLFLDDSPL